MTDPVKVSVGGGLALEVVATNFMLKEDQTKGFILLDLNMGLGATVKVEYPLANHWSVYARAFVDYFPVAGLGIGNYPNESGDEPYTAKGRVNNFSGAINNGLYRINSFGSSGLVTIARSKAESSYSYKYKKQLFHFSTF